MWIRKSELSAVFKVGGSPREAHLAETSVVYSSEKPQALISLHELIRLIVSLVRLNLELQNA